MATWRRASPAAPSSLSARMGTLAAGTGWGEAKLRRSTRPALEQFRQELGAAAPDDDALRPIIGALGGLPLALHLAAGHLQCGRDAGRLPAAAAPAGAVAGADQPGRSQLPRAQPQPAGGRLRAVAGGAGAGGGSPRPAPQHGWTAFQALGYGPAAGFGESLGAAIAGLDEEDFADLARTACALSLLDRVTRGGGTAFRLHPLLAELGRADAPRTRRWPGSPAGSASGCRSRQQEEWRWNEVHAETAALLDWLPLVPPAERVRVERAGRRFAITPVPSTPGGGSARRRWPMTDRR